MDATDLHWYFDLWNASTYANASVDKDDADLVFFRSADADYTDCADLKTILISRRQKEKLTLI